MEIPGTLNAPGDLPVRLDLDLVPKQQATARLLVCIHGSHSSGHEMQDVARAVAGKMSVARITTSRHQDFDPASGQPFVAPGSEDDYMTTGFAGKTYEMELEDVRRAIEHVLGQSEQLFGVPREQVRIDLLGSSLGANLAAEMIGRLPGQVDRLVLAAPPAELGNEDLADKPLLDSFPVRERFLGPLKRFQGEVTLIRGSEDHVVPESAVDEYAAAAQSAKRITIPGAGHSFGTFDFEQSEAEREAARAAYLKVVAETLK
jgi:pimeloyl-ACP methyl ester carboxylesterase